MVSGFSDTSNGIIKVSRFDLMMLQGFSVKKEPTQFTGMKPMKAVLQAKQVILKNTLKRTSLQTTCKATL